MKKEETKPEGEDTGTTKSVSRAEFNTLAKAFKDLVGVVSKGFESVGAIMGKAMDGSAKDTANPDKEKPKDENPTAKALDVEAHDQDAPNKDKPKDETPTAKAEGDEKDETTKADEETDETKKAEETEDETKKAGTEDSTDHTYDIETVNRAIKSIAALTKRMQKADEDEKDETTKAEDETDETKKAEETTDETTKADEATEETTKAHPLDVFVVSMTKAMEAVVERMEKKGHRILGFEKSFIEDIQNSPKAQAEIAKLLKVPGFKKSVAMGVPYMITKEGKRYPLTAMAEKVEKSENKDAKDFRSLYKTKYSSVSPQETNE